MATRNKLRYWFEWGGVCLWDDAGAINAKNLPLSNDTIDRIEEMTTWYSTALNWDDPFAPLQWRQDECDRFNRTAVELHQQIQHELESEFEVINCQGSVTEDPDLEEYLKDPGNFRHKE